MLRSTMTSLRMFLAPLVLAACLLAGGAAAATGVALGWGDCRQGIGGANFDFGCGITANDFPLYASVSLGAAVDSVVAAELVIDVEVASDPLPAWWEMQPGGCRAGVGWLASTAEPASCSDAWGGLGVAVVQGWLPGTPGNSARHGRLLVAASVLPGDAVSFAADQPLVVARVAMTAARVTSCAGCTIPACLVFNSVLIRRLPGSSYETLTVSAPVTVGAERVTWQGGAGADCQAVPVRRSSWGAVKALYR